MELHRRTFLASAAAASLLAGCLGDGGAGSEGEGSGTTTDDEEIADGTTAERSTDSPAATTDETTTTATTRPSAASSPTTDATTATATPDATTQPSGTGDAAATPRTSTATGTVAPEIDHPSAGALGSQPFLGPAPGTAPTLVIAFEDPSCHNCRRFNQNTLPKLESNLVESGETTYVYRNFPHAFAWGEPAMQALEATYARSEAAFWKLKTHYFDTQGEFDESNVLDRTREFLESETDLDAAAVVEDAREGTYDEAFQRDVSAGEAAGVVSTPTFYLFREGSFRTEIRGAQSYQVFTQALGVR